MKQLYTDYEYGTKLEISTPTWPDDKYHPWLIENCSGQWKFYINSIWFEKEEDAVAFKWTWM